MIEQGVVEGLAALPPGLDLGAALDGLDLARVGNDAVVDVLIAQHRQLAREQARSWAVIDEVLHRRRFTRPGVVDRRAALDVDGSAEIRAALSWTRRAAASESDHAHSVVCLLPLVWAALAGGTIDRGKALVFARHLADLAPEQIARICGALLPIAGDLTTGQLEDRIRRMILEIDPTYYEGRYRRALRDRKVVYYLDRDGAATISASGLPADEAAAAMERVDSLARAARRAGHHGTLDQVPADTVLVLLDGSVQGMTREEIITALIARYAGDATADVGGVAPVEEAERTVRGTTGGGDPGGGSGAGAGVGDEVLVPVEPAPGCGGVSSVPVLGPPAASARAPGRRVGAQRVGDQRLGIEIRVPLITLLGHGERAGEIPGLGPVPAVAARHAVTRARRASWRWVVVAPDGRLLTEGITRRRPTGLPTDGPQGGIVELQITEADLLRLAADPTRCGPWAGVVADLASQHQRYRHRERLADLDAHPEDRFPRAGLRRYVQIRDRTCTAPGCRAPAAGADVDHTRDHARGGPTTHDDLGPACRHDHRLKEAGWSVEQPEPGVFVWTSPLGRVYRVRPEPVLPPPVEPVAREQPGWFAEPAADVDGPLTARPRTPRAPPAANAARRPERDPSGVTDAPDPADPPPC